MFHTVLIANRGEIAVRIARTLRRLGIRSVAVYSDADRNAAHVAAADVALPLGGNTPAESYLRGTAIIAAAKQSGAQAIIPGYGFLSENTQFADDCARAGLVFVGPTPDQIRRFGLKHESREIAQRVGVPLVPGSGLLKSLEEARAVASTLGYPVMLKSTAGGGGIGLVRCRDEAALIDAFASVQRQAENFFKDSGVFLERYIERARHVEVQIFGDGRGRVVALGERDCSLQRRNQKVVEETPAPRLPAATRARLLTAAVRLGEAVGYANAGTVEFIYDEPQDSFYFLEVNTRLQVEHPITEAVTGLDLVEWMLRTAAGEPPDLTQPLPEPRGAAVEVRLYAENPLKNFLPSPGTLTSVVVPEGVRWDGWVDTGTEVTPHYDPMLAKLVVHGTDRADAVAKLRAALATTRLDGIATNLDYLRQIAASPEFSEGRVSTRFLDSFAYTPAVIEVVEPGTYTTVQDYPGRVGYWNIGVPPSGPMDSYAFRAANRIVGNDARAAGLEFTLAGATLRFHRPTTVALTGADMQARLDGRTVPTWLPITIAAGQTLAIGRAASGCRGYLAVRGGLDVPDYLGSKSTFALGQFGGHAGRPLRAGDLLPLGADTTAPLAPVPAHAELVPSYTDCWEIGVLYGPHGAPDFFTEESIEAFFATDWIVHYNSNRLGLRLIGPKPTWTRSDGGEAGLHPSNVHDCEYAIGAINFTGDMPIILGCDGPSLGGFVCPATVAQSELWKLGQAKAGDRLRFVRWDFPTALAAERAQDAALATLSPTPAAAPVAAVPPATAKAVSPCVLVELPESGSRPAVQIRQAGDKYLLIEYGPMTLDLKSRFRVHELMESLNREPVEGVCELSPGVRSLQIRYDSRILPQARLLEALVAREERLPDVSAMKIKTRVVRLPMAWQDSATLDAVARYRQSVRDQAPWLPSNVEFIRRINGLASVEDVKRIVFETSYLTLGLGDVYLGAPCAVPVDPRHRLLTSKYNPARTFTAEGTVGIGGVYMCIYGMDSPGGYQLVGRTLPIWNKHLRNPTFTRGEPWLLKFFDQVRFYPVEEAELTAMREDFREGRLTLDIREEIFDFAQYEAFLRDNAADIAAFRARQQKAFAEEIAHWRGLGTAEPEIAAEPPPVAPQEIDGHAVRADMSGNVWKVLVTEGQTVKAGEPLLILEAMKMEFRVPAPIDGTVERILCREGHLATAGDPLLALAPA